MSEKIDLIGARHSRTARRPSRMPAAIGNTAVPSVDTFTMHRLILNCLYKAGPEGMSATELAVALSLLSECKRVQEEARVLVDHRFLKEERTLRQKKHHATYVNIFSLQGAQNAQDVEPEEEI